MIMDILYKVDARRHIMDVSCEARKPVSVQCCLSCEMWTPCLVFAPRSSPLSIVFTKCESLEPGPHSSYCQGKNWILLIFTTQATVRNWERVTQEWGHLWITQSLSSTSQEVCCGSIDVFVVVSSEQVCGYFIFHVLNTEHTVPNLSESLNLPNHCVSWGT